MILGGLQKLTLVDYPGKLAATVFTVGCNFRCPFCHNPELVMPSDKFKRGVLSEEDFFKFLGQRQGKLEGVCITGGEPTIQKGILDFLFKIKELGFLVKLDSNGTNPEILEKVFSEKLVDFVAMDIKNTLAGYSNTCGTEVKTNKIAKSVELIRNSGIAYEFRTTVVPGIHVLEDFILIGKWLNGIDRFALQEYRNEGKVLNEKLMKNLTGEKLDLEIIKKILESNFKEVIVR
jgi:pyruvate formate lyase activating enzyme